MHFPKEPYTAMLINWFRQREKLTKRNILRAKVRARERLVNLKMSKALFRNLLNTLPMRE